MPMDGNCDNSFNYIFIGVINTRADF